LAEIQNRVKKNTDDLLKLTTFFETPLTFVEKEQHMTTTRTAVGHWAGTLLEGEGTVALASSGLGTFAVNWASRANEADGKTSPEELLAAAHAACFSMAFSAALAANKTPAVTIDTSVEVDFQPGEGITGIRISVNGRAEGLDNDAFYDMALAAKQNCPVSKALAAVPIALIIPED
jgi:osmotically inducible protein OsmC